MKTNLNYNQYIPTHILFGAGQLNNLHAQQMPGKKALIIIPTVSPLVPTAIWHARRSSCI